MRKTLRVLLAILSVGIAVLAIISFVYRLGDARTSGERSSGAEYSILRNALISIRSKDDLQDQFLRDRLLALYRGSERLLAVQVLDESGLVAWKIPAESQYFALPNDPSVRSGFSAPQGSTVVFSTPLSEGMKLLALYTTVRRSDVSRAAQLPALILGLWCIVVVVGFIFLRKDKVSAILPEAVDTSKAGTGEEEAPPAEALPEEETVLPEAHAQAEPAMPIGEEPQEEAAGAQPETYPETGPAPEKDLLEQSFPAAGKPLSTSAGAGASFEESLAKLEEEIIEWSARYPEHAKKQDETQDLSHNEKEIPKKEPAEVPQPRDRLDEELQEEIEEIESAEEEESASGADVDMEDSSETLQDFEEIRADEYAKQKEVDTTQPETGYRPPVGPAEPASALRARGAAPEKHDVTALPMPLSLSDSMLEHKLGEEIIRGEDTETTLMLIHCEVNGPGDPAAVALAATIRDYFGAKDLIFEMYKGAFAIVLPSIDLGSALKMSEDLADVLSATISLYRDIEGEAPVFIGISSRSSRAVDAFKLYREASTAIHKAYAGGHSRILAFRPKAV